MCSGFNVIPYIKQSGFSKLLISCYIKFFLGYASRQSVFAFFVHFDYNEMSKKAFTDKDSRVNTSPAIVRSSFRRLWKRTVTQRLNDTRNETHLQQT